MSTPQQAHGTGRTIEEAFREAALKLRSDNADHICARLTEILYISGDDPQGRIPQSEEGYYVTAELAT